MIEILALTPDDWRLWRRLRLDALTEAPYAFGSRLADWQGDGDREERWRGRLSVPGSYNLLALADGDHVGMAGGIPAPHGHAELISLWVAPAARGLGVGDALIRAVERWAADNGAPTLRLAVAPDNTAALALYARHAFTPTAEPGDLLPDGRRELILAKPL
ncbi:GNAT family N-acetyltransferase [Streptantibioticus cattleyicolor]|uniref:Acetyltransferase n=1 Tax=Streptantibioticus cattleyicolor (strain ATCC 35852 / DSM 46488 / JCM 4925 / NBRC 14057 / NRRL 8057) TaxID=1003195 RepID=F8JNJ2_STREN|nr:GNAT family N-acetyltransferase [Streptantibioticus cattleyicolor]AEW99039.1 acetyltransferase [Streptantibioticus cattleyicolor NRRL 8057 = DSM 46488]CCB71912.1 putative acetyltransferase [Streptantibioticus cattleyicolor NRRL 8057 = DSM 46488]